VGKVAFEHLIFRVLFSLRIMIPSMRHTHLALVAGTTDQSERAVPRD
jgi:hypothetical protein